MLKTTNATAISVFAYEGNNIAFSKNPIGGGKLLINATQMAKPFGKVAKDWLRTNAAKDFINSLSAVRQICPTDLVVTKQGGNDIQGTWMHEDVALEFARWLSPAFAIWCNDRIKELLTTGVATVRNDDEAIAYAMDVLNHRLAESHQQLQIAQGTIERQEDEIKELAPKAQYTDEVLQSTSTYTLTQVAHDLGLRSVHALTRILMEKKILFRQSGQWQPTAKVATKGYFNTRTAKYIKSDNTVGTSISTVITESGRQFLHNLINGRF